MQRIRDIMQHRQAGILDDLNSIHSAVMLPLLERDGRLFILFEVRSYELKGQPGEICFPGGHIETGDESPKAAAIRETAEELGLKPSDITVLGSLDILVTSAPQIIHPYVAYISPGAVLKPQLEEVAEIFCVPLDYFRQTEPIISFMEMHMTPAPHFPVHLLPNGKDYNWRSGKYPVYFYTYDKYIIWGITARILYHFLKIIKDSE